MIEIRTTIDDLTLEETSESVAAAFPYRGNREVFVPVTNCLCPWHWHNEVELFYIEFGCLRYCLPGMTRDFHAGEVGFVNANVLHMTQSLGDGNCVQQEHIFLPRLVGGTSGSAIEQRYVQPLLKNREAELIALPADHPRASGMRRQMDAALRAFQGQAPGYEIAVRDALSALWLDVLALAPEARDRRSSVDDDRLKAMLRFIDAHFAERLTLADIAAAASVGPRESARCFRRALNMSPIEYLLSYRIDRAGELLRATGRSVTGISLSCGFGSVSYFGKLFREKLGVSPSEYRRLQQ